MDDELPDLESSSDDDIERDDGGFHRWRTYRFHKSKVMTKLCDADGKGLNFQFDFQFVNALKYNACSVDAAGEDTRR